MSESIDKVPEELTEHSLPIINTFYEYVQKKATKTQLIDNLKKIGIKTIGGLSISKMLKDDLYVAITNAYKKNSKIISQTQPSVFQTSQQQPSQSKISIKDRIKSNDMILDDLKDCNVRGTSKLKIDDLKSFILSKNKDELPSSKKEQNKDNLCDIASRIIVEQSVSEIPIEQDKKQLKSLKERMKTFDLTIEDFVDCSAKGKASPFTLDYLKNFILFKKVKLPKQQDQTKGNLCSIAQEILIKESLQKGNEIPLSKLVTVEPVTKDEIRLCKTTFSDLTISDILQIFNINNIPLPSNKSKSNLCSILQKLEKSGKILQKLSHEVPSEIIQTVKTTEYTPEYYGKPCNRTDLDDMKTFEDFAEQTVCPEGEICNLDSKYCENENIVSSDIKKVSLKVNNRDYKFGYDNQNEDGWINKFKKLSGYEELIQPKKEQVKFEAPEIIIPSKQVLFTEEQKELSDQVQTSIEKAKLDKEIQDIIEANMNQKPVDENILKISMMPQKIELKELGQTDISALRAKLQEIQIGKKNLPLGLLKNFKEVSEKIQKCVGRVA